MDNKLVRKARLGDFGIKWRWKGKGFIAPRWSLVSESDYVVKALSFEYCLAPGKVPMGTGKLIFRCERRLSTPFILFIRCQETVIAAWFLRGS